MNTKTRPYEDVVNELREYEFEMLSLKEDYRITEDKIYVKCKNNHIQYTRFHNLQNKGFTCSECYRESQYNRFAQILKDKNYTIKTKLEDFKNTRTDIEYYCDKGHYHKSMAKNLYIIKGCRECANIRFSKERSGERGFNWKGGTSPLSNYIRDKIKQWKQDSIKANNYRCVLTGNYFDKIHHLYAFNTILEETMNNLQLSFYQEINQYTQDELQSIENECIKLHEEYGLGVCLCDKLHRLFHNLYGQGNNAPQQFKEFATRLENGEFSDFLEENNLTLNINYEVLDELLNNESLSNQTLQYKCKSNNPKSTQLKEVI